MKSKTQVKINCIFNLDIVWEFMFYFTKSCLSLWFSLKWMGFHVNDVRVTDLNGLLREPPAHLYPVGTSRADLISASPTEDLTRCSYSPRRSYEGTAKRGIVWFFSFCPSLLPPSRSPHPASHQPNENGPAPGFFLLKASFPLQLLLVGCYLGEQNILMWPTTPGKLLWVRCDATRQRQTLDRS